VSHPAVKHPVVLRIKRHRGRMGAVGRVNDYLLTHLAVVFGLAWTVWVFMVVTVGAYWAPPTLQSKIFFFSSGCIQLFALPLMVYVGNKLQRSSDAQSEVMHQALTHIATVSDQNKALLEQNTKLTSEVHALVAAAQVSGGAGPNPAEAGLPADQRVVPPPATRKLRKPGGD
jgi:hypothetical protein